MDNARRRIMFANLVATCVVLALLSTAMNVAVPSVSEGFGIAISTGQWLVSGYSLALAAVTPMTAWLSVRFSGRRLYLVALGSYFFATLACALAPTFVVLLGARVAQACANALIATLTQVSILRLYDGKGQGSAMGWFGLSQGAATVAGPSLCGLVIDLLGWRLLFMLAALLCVASWVLALASMKNLTIVERQSLDVPSFVLSVVGLTGISLGLGSLGAPALVFGIVAVALFVLRQKRLDQPFLDVFLLRDRVFARASVGGMLLYAVMMSSAVILPMYVQTGAGMSAAVSGVVMLPGALAMALVAPVAGKLYDRFGMRMLLLVGGFMLFVSNAVGAMLLVAFADAWLVVVALTVLNVVRLLGVGILQMPLVTWGISSVAESRSAHASALMTTLRNVAGAVSVVVFTFVAGATVAVASGVAAAYLGLAVLSAFVLALAATRNP